MTTGYRKSLKKRMINDGLYVDDSSGTPVLKDGKDRVIGGGSGGGVNWGEIGGSIANQLDLVSHVNNRVNQEGTIRLNADNELQAGISAEEAARIAAIAAIEATLGDKVDTATLNAVVAQFTEEVENIYERIGGKQNRLTAGTNITIIDDVISATGGGGAAVWGDITGELSRQKDLYVELENKANSSDVQLGLETERNRAELAENNLLSLIGGKQNHLTPGMNITIVDDVISAEGTAAVWGGITGRLGDQQDLMDLFGTKAEAADLTAESATRANADNALRADVDLNTAAIGGLNTELGAEVTARGNADAALADDITAEATIREDHDVALENSINGEAQIREANDNALQTAINGKQNTITYGTADPSGGQPGDVYIKIAS